jgi:hypothetical protein
MVKIYYIEDTNEDGLSFWSIYPATDGEKELFSKEIDINDFKELEFINYIPISETDKESILYELEKKQLNDLDVFGIVRKRFREEETKEDKKYLIEQIYQLAQELECELESEEKEE